MTIMANLIVRNLEQNIVDALKKQASKHGCSAEAEHRQILKKALIKTNKISLVEALAKIPNVGEDQDFERIDLEESKNVFD